MKDEQDIYDILSPKFEDNEVPFNAEHWKSMKSMIDASRAANRRTVWLMISLGLLLLAGGTFAVYNWNTVNGKSNAISAVSTQNRTQKSVAISSTQNHNAASHVEIANSTIANNDSHSNLPSNETMVKNKNQTSSHKTLVSLTLANNSQHQNSNQRIERNKNIANPGSQTIVSNNIASSNNAPSAQQNNIVQGGEQNNITPSTQQINNAPSTQNNLPQTVQQNSTIQSVKQNSIIGKHAAESNVVISHKPIIGSPTIVHKTDSAAESLPKRFSDEPRIFRGKSDIFSAELGTQWSGGWQIGSVIQGKGLNPIIGVGYAHYVGHKVFLKIGLQFSTFGNMNTLPYIYQHNVGNEIYDSAITTKRLYFLRIPVQFERSIGHNKMKSSWGFGGSAWVLLGNSGSASTYQLIDNNPPINMVQYSQNAPLNGYTKVNASAHALYRYTITHNFSMCGLFYYEITSMKDNSFFGGNIIEKTYGFEATLSYSFN